MLLSNFILETVTHMVLTLTTPDTSQSDVHKQRLICSKYQHCFHPIIAKLTDYKKFAISSIVCNIENQCRVFETAKVVLYFSQAEVFVLAFCNE